MNSLKKALNWWGHTPEFFRISTFITAAFLLAVSLDFSPFLRGPAPYYPDWRWEYLYVPTWERIWVPGIVGLLIILFFKAQINLKSSSNFFFLASLVVLGITFNLSITHFERSGINVLVARIVDEGNNGYFTSATEIENVSQFISSFDKRVLSLHQHAEGHPPGAILLHKAVNETVRFFDLKINIPPPSTEKIRSIWQGLTAYQQAGSILSIGIILFLSNLSAVIVFFITKNLYGIKTAKLASIFTILIPAASYFYPLPDSYYPLFVLLAFLFMMKNSNFYVILSGLIYSIGLFFSFSLLPFMLFYILYIFFQNLADIEDAIKRIIYFVLSIAGFYVAMFFVTGYNIVRVFSAVMGGLPEDRNYLTWLFYNPYDFLIFAGIPMSILFLFALKKYFSLLLQSNDKLSLASINSVLFSATTMLLLLIVSGSVRGEVGRIWLPIMPFVAIFAAQFIQSSTKKQSLYLVIIALIITQTIVLQEFWVMLW